ncbi:TetR/AcrR family transcriptional regulator [Leifsonia sp. ZF2019]|uniref:TetR/AcrR family transcriptional regulator n=1 Tax=Leifsonia sp. ZF2019 TaxID=2781978 RepID=UPI001CBABC3A|nr:TetR/AcrR family transcriptional regulator [Leifsonia sp. ZF2019]UAJ79293.1 TetR/AcrR family transcriptional regulator [Leifsonia sp. ZF2019]
MRVTSVIDGSRFARAAATRQAIVEAATALFAEQGFRAVSLREIAARAGISHPALLKHFSGREELLAEVARRIDDGLCHGAPGAATDDGLPFAAQASAPSAAPEAVRFFAALTGEASATSHPLHAVMRERVARVRAERQGVLERASASGALGEGRDPADEATRLTAAWAGLHLVEQYVPERVDSASRIAAHERLLADPPGRRDPGDERGDGASPPARPLPPLVTEDASPVAPGYRAGRQRRAKIVADATALFAREGYGDTSLLDIAQRVGVSKSAIYHHFPAKDALLHEVLRERDRRIDGVVEASPALSAADTLRGLADGAARNETEQPGLIELYAVISSEATPLGHAAHGYFEQRFARALDGFTRMFQDAAAAGDLPAHRDPEHEACWLLALWDGLQYEWLYDPESVDVPGQLRAHLADVLPA